MSINKLYNIFLRLIHYSFLEFLNHKRIKYNYKKSKIKKYKYFILKIN